MDAWHGVERFLGFKDRVNCMGDMRYGCEEIEKRV